MDAFWKEKKHIEKICSFHGLDDCLAWSMILDGKSDFERIVLFGRTNDDVFKNQKDEDKQKPQLYNVWNFSYNSILLVKIFPS
jgi:hypothetical protein